MNSEEEQKLKKEGWWMTLLVVIPAIYLSFHSDLFFEDGFGAIAISGVLGGIGGTIGAVIYYLTKEKSTPFRTLTLISLILLLFLMTILMNKTL